MKILTLNSHSLEEEHYEEKLTAFIEGICREQPQVIALQEVNQTRDAAAISEELLAQSGYLPCNSAPDGGTAAGEAAAVREDNHAYRAAKALRQRGISYFWTWVSAKIGYGKYDEGLALFSLLPVLDTRQFYITGIHAYENWRTRKILGVRAATEQGIAGFYSVHMGWWKDEEEPFEKQWKRMAGLLLTEEEDVTWLLGDFNSPAHVPGEGYDLVRASGWLDTYELAKEKDGGITVDHLIDGWREKKDSGMRIDYIWTNQNVPVKYSRVLFDGKHYPAVSDHFGVLVELGDEKEWK